MAIVTCSEFEMKTLLLAKKAHLEFGMSKPAYKTREKRTLQVSSHNGLQHLLLKVNR